MHSLSTDKHISASDARLHYTLDAFRSDGGVDKPIGCIHVYEDDKLELEVYTKVRRKAKEVCLFFAIQSENTAYLTTGLQKKGEGWYNTPVTLQSLGTAHFE